MNSTPYKKSWLTHTRIARLMLETKLNSRIPTIREYAIIFDCASGVIQNALKGLEQAGAIELDKRGKNGTFLVRKDEEKLFDNAGLHFITGSMPSPLSIHHAGLATGICQAMNSCTVPFTFAFVQGSKNRVEAMLRKVYDFVVVTLCTAETVTSNYPELEIAFLLEDCEYSCPYTLYLNQPGLNAIQDGMTVAADPHSIDQWALTQAACKGKSVSLIEMPYISCNFAFLGGKVDAVIMQGDLSSIHPSLNNLFVPGENSHSMTKISAIPVAGENAAKLKQPVILVNKDNYGIGGILENYLSGNIVAQIQKLVIDFKMAPQFY
jgi:hypothetical protein